MNLRVSIDRCQTVEVTLAGTVTAGDIDAVGNGALGIAVEDGVADDVINYVIEAPAEGAVIPATTADVWAIGDKVYYDTSGAKLTDSVSGGIFCGIALEAKTGSQTTNRINFLGHLSDTIAVIS